MLAAFLTEERKVGWDGYVHFAGSRYGVPWQYAGQRVEVRETASVVEIRSNGKVLVLHPKAVKARSTLTAPGQWDGLHTASAQPARDKLALQVDAPEVQVRPLTAYAALVGGE